MRPQVLCVGVVVKAGVEMNLSFAGTVSALLSWKQMEPKVPLLAMQQQQERATILDSIFHANIFTVTSNKVRK